MKIHFSHVLKFTGSTRLNYIGFFSEQNLSLEVEFSITTTNKGQSYPVHLACLILLTYLLP